MFRFNHYNFNISDLERSLEFYDKALGLKPVRRKDCDDGYTLVYLGDGVTGFTLELTKIHQRSKPYDLGECEFHLCLDAEDVDAAYAKHRAMGIVCQEQRKSGGFYFISDPDGYWIEIVQRKERT